MGYHFISYSSTDAGDFAERLACELAAAPSGVAAWVDKRELMPGRDWDEQISRAIERCESVLFVMTRDSVSAHSVCKREWTRALKYGKPVIPLQLHHDAELPFLLEPRQYIDFTRSFAAGLQQLRSHLLWLSEPAGVLRTLEDRLADAQRELARAPEEDRPRVLEEVAELERQIASQKQIVGESSTEDRLLKRRRQDLQVERPVAETSVAEIPVAETPNRARAAKAWDPALLERARKDLAAYIGPMAKVIVRRAAERALSLDELYKALATEIGSQNDRERFLASRPL